MFLNLPYKILTRFDFVSKTPFAKIKLNLVFINVDATENAIVYLGEEHCYKAKQMRFLIMSQPTGDLLIHLTKQKHQ